MALKIIARCAALTRPIRADFTYHAARRSGSNSVRGRVRCAVAISSLDIITPVRLSKCMYSYGIQQDDTMKEM